jgi:putative N6-adenine-specific DNA methylase
MKMDHPPATQKRIKRHVIGQSHTFFATTSPGLEPLCAREIADLQTGIDHIDPISGGVLFTCRLAGCYAANLHLRIPNRILMRLTDFKATNFRQLDKKIMQFPWELYLSPSSDRDIRVTTRHSRLFHTTAITQHMETCIRQRLAQTPSTDTGLLNNKDCQHLYARAVDDHLFLSLDSSGDLLFKRGLKQDVGKAPLRETLAAAILKRVGYDGTQRLLDPMCGSGTFSLEAAMLAGNIPPGFFRDFAFMRWPAFRESQWRHLKHRAENTIKPQIKPLIFASDLDSKRTTELKKISDRFEWFRGIHVETRDFFDLRPRDVTQKPGILVLNPPFGLRLKTLEQSKAFYGDIIRKLKTDYRHWQTAVLVKDKAIVKQFPDHFERHALFHGGIDLTLLIGKIR